MQHFNSSAMHVFEIKFMRKRVRGRARGDEGVKRESIP
jgi:hypothetical protein